jgi:hypothetical protein
MTLETKFCITLDVTMLERAKIEAINSGVPTTITDDTGSFIRYLLKEYLAQKPDSRYK